MARRVGRQVGDYIHHSQYGNVYRIIQQHTSALCAKMIIFGHENNKKTQQGGTNDFEKKKNKLNHFC